MGPRTPEGVDPKFAELFYQGDEGCEDDGDGTKISEDASDAAALAGWEKEDSPSGKTERLLSGIPVYYLGDY